VSGLRLFVALELPAEARREVAAVGAAADRRIWRALEPEALHVTLAFLGRRPEEELAAIERIVAAEAGGPAPRLALAGALLLPPRRARVLAVALADPDGRLATLQARVAAALAAAGVYAPETRPFRAHVTAARLRPGAEAPRTVGFEPTALAFAAPAVTLYESRLLPTGARYDALARAPLSAG
jgi:2'-5' RNA ligase